MYENISGSIICSPVPTIRRAIVRYTAMSNSVVKEISTIRNFVTARVELNGSCDPNLVKSFADGVIQMINTSQHFGVTDGSLVTEALKNSPFGDEHTSRITAAVDARMSAGNQAKGRHQKGKHDGAPQALKHWWNFCSNEDWKIFNDAKKPFSAKMTAAAERGISIGLTNPDEQTLKWLLAMLLAVHYPELPSYRQIYEKLQELKLCYNAEKKPFPHEQPVVFPETASELPQCIIDYAYTAEDPAVCVHCHGINTVAEHIPLRSNSKLLKSSTTKPPAMATAPAAIKVEASAAGARGAGAEDALPRGAEAPTDPEELALWHEYQSKLATLRASRQQMQQRDARQVLQLVPPKEEASSPGIVLRPRGSLNLSRTVPPAATAKAEEAHAERPTLEDVEDLDEWGAEAFNALKARAADDKETKKAVAAAKKAAAKAAAKSEEGEACDAEPPARKRGRPAKTEKPKTEKLKTEETKKLKKEITEVSESSILKAMPKPKEGDENPTPVHYKGGVVYTVVGSKLFRALAVRGDRYTEKRASWASTGKHGSLPAAWKFAISHIENFKKKKKESTAAAAATTVMKKKKVMKAKAKPKAKSKP
jgi:hypothetical protein